MARNEEKHYGKLNRLYLMKEKEEYDKVNPKRPRLDILETPEEIQSWLPNIKKDIEFYLKKSQVTCYSDAHVQTCLEKVVKLEKEFKAFIYKMHRLSSGPLDAIPWTNRPYKRRKSYDEENPGKEFKRIATPILDNQNNSNDKTSQFLHVNLDDMDQPLNFSSISTNNKKTEEKEKLHSNLNISNPCVASTENETIRLNHIVNHPTKCSIVNYDSSDSESS